MKKLLSLLVAISMMTSILSGMVVFASEEPVIIYEENFDKDSLPAGWELPAKASMQSEYAKSGNAIRIVDDSDTAPVHVKSPYIDVVGGELYSASAEVLSLSSTDLGISFKFFDKEMVQVKTAQYYTTNDEFTQVSAVLTAPENAAYCRVFFISNGATISDGFFDDVRIVRGVIWPDKLNTMIPPKQSDPVDGQLIKPVDDMLEYNTYNNMGDKLGDFSKAGFYRGEYELPDSSKLEVVATIEPSDDPTADDTDRIQAVIDDVYNNAANDYFKVIKLKAGRYNINSYGLNLKSGIILSGEGQGPEGTVLYATDAKRYTVVKIMGIQNKALTDNHYILDEYVPAGSNKISLSDEDIKEYKVGDLVTICHDGTEEWSAAMEMDGIIDVYGDPTYWSKGKTDMKEERYIEAIHGNTITFDMPFYVPYDTKYSPVYIYKTDDSGRVEHIGIENLRIESSFNVDPNDEKHADNAISISNAKNCFVRDVSAKYITLSAVVCENGAKQITVKNCSYLEPVSTVAGGRRYAFYAAQKSQQIYFTGCYAYNGRHDYMASYTATGPIVFTDNVDDYSNAQNETHGTWSTGVLYDNLFVVGSSTSGWLGLTNRGHYGTTASQGWTTAGSVAWNCLSPLILAHKPPLTYQNFIIGEWGHYSDSTAKGTKLSKTRASESIYKTALITEPQPENFATSDNTSFVGDAYKESETAPVEPRSLYKAQLAERLTGSYKNTKPNAPIITSPRGEEEHKLTSNDVTVSGIYQKGAEKVTIYIDNEPNNATINKNDYSFELKVNLEDGTHKIYATQTIDGIESTKCADRFVVINGLNGNPDYLQSQYDYNMIHQITNDDVVSFDVQQKIEESTKSDKVTVKVNGSKLSSDVDPIKINDRVLVPLRDIFEEFEAKVSWDESTRSATVTKENRIVQVTENSNITKIDGEIYILDVPTTMVNGKLFVPVRFISESLGANVEWIGLRKTVNITGGKVIYPPVHGLENEVGLYGAIQSGDDGAGAVISRVFDNNFSTSWGVSINNKNGAYGILDLGMAKTVKDVYIAFFKGDQRTYTFDIQISLDGKNYTVISEYLRNSGTSVGLEAFPINEYTRFIKIVGHGNSTNEWNNYTEMAVTESK